METAIRLKYKDALTARNMSVRAFTIKSGTPRGNLSKLEKNIINAKLSTIVALAAKISSATGIPCSPSELYDWVAPPTQP